jgi:hypothetical protein
MHLRFLDFENKVYLAGIVEYNAEDVETEILKGDEMSHQSYLGGILS